MGYGACPAYEREAVCVSLGKHLFPSLSVTVDNTRAAQDAVDYLIGLGHTEIAYISGPKLLTTAELRLRGYEQAMEQHGLTVREEFILTVNTNMNPDCRRPGPFMLCHTSRRRSWLPTISWRLAVSWG